MSNSTPPLSFSRDYSESQELQRLADEQAGGKAGRVMGMMAVRTRWFDDQIHQALHAEQVSTKLEVEGASRVDVTLQVCRVCELRAHLAESRRQIVESSS